MFSIIITMLTVAFVALITGISVYYFGDMVYAPQQKANATAVINSAVQIGAAVNMYQTEHRGSPPETLDTLIETGYLHSLPDGTWEFGDERILALNLDEDICKTINERLTDEATIPQCDAGGAVVGCCSSEQTQES